MAPLYVSRSRNSCLNSERIFFLKNLQKKTKQKCCVDLNKKIMKTEIIKHLFVTIDGPVLNKKKVVRIVEKM